MGIGLGITVEVLTAREISSRVASGKYQIALTGIESPYDNAVDLLSSFLDSGIFTFPDDGYSNIIARLLTVETDEDMLNGCFTAESYLLGSGMFFPVYERSSRFVTAEDIDGIYMCGSESTVCFVRAKRYD